MRRGGEEAKRGEARPRRGEEARLVVSSPALRRVPASSPPRLTPLRLPALAAAGSFLPASDRPDVGGLLGRHLAAADGSLVFEVAVLSAVIAQPIYHYGPVSESLSRLYSRPGLFLHPSARLGPGAAYLWSDLCSDNGDTLYYLAKFLPGTLVDGQYDSHLLPWGVGRLYSISGLLPLDARAIIMSRSPKHTQEF